MHAPQDRPARKTDPDRAPARRPRPRSGALRLAVSLASLALLLLSAAPAQATTGGASAFSGVAAAGPEGAAAAGTPTDGAELAFGPTLWAGASWYGPGLYGRSTACGQKLRAKTIGVAHRSLPCGTIVKFVYRGRAVIAPVIDRGPYVKGRAWDLTKAASDALQFEGVGRVQYSVALAYARQQPAR